MARRRYFSFYRKSRSIIKWIIYVLKEKISFNYPSFSHINLNNIVYCMHAIFIVTTHKYLQRVSCREVYVLHTYSLCTMSWAYLFLEIRWSPLELKSRKKKTLMLGWHLVKRPPADEADDLFFVWNREIQDLEKMLLLKTMMRTSLWWCFCWSRNNSWCFFPKIVFYFNISWWATNS